MLARTQASKTTRKKPDPIDKHVGNRVRARRLMLEMSQEKLATALGITFQQVQKYEKGTNRIAPSRMLVIARTLKVPVSHFYDGLGAEDDGIGAQSEEQRFLADFMASRIESVPLQRRIVDLVQEMTADE